MNGVLCLDKPPEMTSFRCCAAVRRLLGGVKTGHAGTLDPMATGVLPLLVGSMTRALDRLPVHDKQYVATLRFGYVSDTLDVWGQVEPTGTPAPARAAIEAVLPSLRGDILQVPPMMSALKRDGVRLYDLARQGIEVEREARPVTIHTLDIQDYDPDTAQLTICCTCSKGTYIRTLCDDIGRLTGAGAVMTALRRTMASGFTLAQCVTLEEAERLAQAGELAGRLIPPEVVFGACPKATVTGAQAVRFCNGGALSLNRLRVPVKGLVRVYGPDGAFLGLGEPEGGELRVRGLF